MRREIQLVKMAALALLLTLGCYSVPKPEPTPAPQVAEAHPFEEYRLRIGDQLSIKFFYDPQLDEDVVIRPDGRISLPLVGEVLAAGRTPAELRQTLVEAYTGTLRQPEPTIILREFGSHAIYVGGEVQKPGAIPLTGSMTTLQAIFAAGGHRRTAELETVVVLRFNGTAQPRFFTTNLIDQLEGRAQTDVLLKPQDMVFVPKTWIGHVNDFMDLYFDDLFPASRHIGLGFSYDLRDRDGGDTTFITNNP
jgi:protein involved in polysaccharide export with SLBB domain